MSYWGKKDVVFPHCFPHGVERWPSTPNLLPVSVTCEYKRYAMRGINTNNQEKLEVELDALEKLHLQYEL